MNYELLTPIRNLTRKIGLNKFIAQIYFKNWQKQLQADYESTRPKVVNFETNGNVIQMHVANFAEYERVMSFKNDEKIISAILSEMDANDKAVFWDVGANIGLYSVFLAAVGKPTTKVISFEPEPRCAKRIQENQTLNGLAKITIHQFALSSSEGEMELVVNEDYGAGNHSLVSKHLDGVQNLEKVKVETGNRVVSLLGETLPTVVKIDVEGAEIDVLKGMNKILSQPVCKAVMCEVHFTILDAAGHSNGASTIKQLLKNSGFTKFTWIDPSHLFAQKQ